MKQELFSHTRSAAFGAFLFLAFVLIGSAYIIWGKLFHVSAWLVTSVPLALMILYTFTLLLARYFRLRDDQAGDNLYYLGFLYTLTSLGVSLWQFRIEDGGEHIVTNFGIAIASTILGVALRVVFNQMRQDPLEVERVARLQLADAARRVKQELDSTTFEFASFRRATQQMLEESLREKREQAERLATEIFEGIAKIPERSAQPLTEASEEGRARIEQLANAVEELSSSLQKLETDLKAMQRPDGIIEIKLQPVIRGFTKAINDQSKATAAQVAELQKVIGQFDQSVQKLAESLETGMRDRATDQQVLRDLVTKTHAEAADTRRLLTELERTLSAPPSVAIERPEAPRGWSSIFRGTSS